MSKRGRPRTAHNLASAATNYQALAWQVKETIADHQTRGQKISIRSAVRAEMIRSAQERNVAVFRVGEREDTAYIEVRKILKSWKKTTP
jgi:hypothetical protein